MFILASVAVSVAAAAPWQNNSLSIDARVANLVSLLTLSEKVANLYSNAAPGAPRLGLPPYRYDEECMRGAVTSGVAVRPLGTGFPTLLALAGTFNVSLLASVGAVGAREIRAYYNIDRRTAGLTTTANCYAPVVNLVRDPLWGRNAEMAMGEDPTLGRVYARAWTAAMRGSAPGDTHKLVTSVCKHLGTYGGPEDNGGSRFSFDASLDERTWRESFLPAFRGSAEGGTDSYMCSYSAVSLTDAPEKLSHTPDCASGYMLNTVVRGEWNWTGFVTSDAMAVDKIFSAHGYVNSTAAAAIAAVSGGCDMELVCCSEQPVFPTLVDSVNSGLLDPSIIDTAITRVLKARFAVGDLDPPTDSPWAGLNESDIYSPSSLALAREAARASVVLLVNRGSTPLPWTRPALAGKVVCVVGPLANSTQDFMGGYTSVPRPGDIISPLRAFRQALAGTVKDTLYIPGCSPGDGVVCAALQAGLNPALKACDAIVLVLGTSAYAQVHSSTVNLAHEGEGKDRTGVGLAGQQGGLLAAVRNMGKPLAVVVASGGMVEVGGIGDANALLAAPFGGQWAGDAIAAVILGDENPAGRLTTTWYTTAAFAALGGLTNYSMKGRTYRYAAPGDARFPFGHGESFSNFSYTSLKVTPASPGPCDILTVTATLTNTGGPMGAEVAQLYTAFPGASVPAQPIKALVNWDKVMLAPGASTTLTLTISPEDNAVLREGDFVPVIEPGARTLWLGGSSDSGGVTPGLAGGYTIQGSVTPLAQCSGGVPVRNGAAAHVWPPPLLGGGGAARWAGK